MATTTTNFGWDIPQSTDLVKDGATAIAALGQDIDTALVDLKGGTTGQVLSKASNTDLDYTWVTQDDANAIQNSIVDAKGDLISATGNDVPARLAVGNNGESLVADSSATTGLRWQGNYSAGKNAIINGDFSIWQRGTSFTAYSAYWSDRWTATGDRTSPSFSRQTFTAGTAPVAGYESEFYARWVPGSSGTFSNIQQRIEGVRTFANQIVTLSYWARISTGTATNSPYIIQNFGSGGSAEVSTALSTNTITTTWTRFSHTFTVPSVSGKTIGTGNYLNILPLRFESASTADVDVWGVQLEAGNVATAFQTATGTLAGELAACQRYYWRSTTSTSGSHGIGATQSTTSAIIGVNLPVTMRIVPTSIDYSNLRLVNYGVAAYAITAITLSASETTQNFLNMDCSGATGMTANRPVFLYGTGSSGYIGANAEL